LVAGDVLSVYLSQFLEENIANLKGDTLTEKRFPFEKLENDLGVPLEISLTVVSVFQESEEGVDREPDEHQELVDSEVVHSVPVVVEDVQKLFEPELLVLGGLDSSENIADPLGCSFLIQTLIRVPIYYANITQEVSYGRTKLHGCA
jgi:hypothetical protein